jgi:hypothetical protein
MDDFISIKDFAKSISRSFKSVHGKIKRKNLRQYCELIDIGPGNKVLVIPNKNLSLFKEKFEEEPKDLSSGYFYVMKVMPHLNSKLIKLGFTGSLKSRLSDYHTFYGNLYEVVISFPCKSTWEKTAIDYITQEDCMLIENATELFECNNIERVLENCKKFFSMMPKLNEDLKTEG